jgi:uracil-DNA glycosylase family 4
MALSDLFKNRPKKVASVTKSVSMSPAKCGLCGRKKKNAYGDYRCVTPEMPVYGKGKQKILIVAMQPTEGDDLRGKWLSGDSYKWVIQPALEQCNLDLYHDCWSTGAILCYGKTDYKLSLDCCLSNLIRTIEQLKPIVIISLGEYAAKSIFKVIDSQTDVEKFHGYQLPIKKWNCWFCPVMDIRELNPTKIETEYGSTNRFSQNQLVQHLWLGDYIDSAVSKLPKRPFNDEKPEKIRLLYETNEICSVLEAISTSKKGFVAFDYECNCLKPEIIGAKCLCASVCIGDENKPWCTYAFPFSSKEIKEKWVDFLKSPIPKVAHNVKFELRWSKVHFKTDVNNWLWDSMLAAHIIDCRKGVTGLKFQTFVNFGVAGYEDETKQYMDGINSWELNRLEECPPEILLRYCAEDANYTHRLCALQRRISNM